VLKGRTSAFARQRQAYSPGALVRDGYRVPSPGQSGTAALGLATPVAIMAGTGRGAQLGLLIRGGESLERIHGLSTAVLDKTGTLTEGRPAVVRLLPLAGSDGRDALALAAGAEAASEHPLARAVVAAAEARGLVPARADDVEAAAGQG
jgi:P-type Cu+ transporter